MTNSDSKPKMTATYEERAEAFERARNIMNKIIPVIAGADSFDLTIALQMLIAREAQKSKTPPQEVLKVMAMNLPTMLELWEQAFRDIDKETAH